MNSRPTNLWRQLWADIPDTRWIVAKGLLFLLAGALATAGIAVDCLTENASARTLLLHGVAIWCFCRFYFFAFSVVTNWVDPSFRFDGLGSLLVWLWQKRRRR